MAKEIRAAELNAEQFIAEKVREIKKIVGKGIAINALSGGVDSSVVTALGHRALGERLKTCFIENGLMRQDEPKQVKSLFQSLGIPIEVIDARKAFFKALKGITDPEEKREAITQTFYKKVFGELVVQSGAKHLLQGTILTDIDETVAGIKRQHNVFEQLGIDPQKVFGYKIIEPLIQLRKDGVRKVGAALGLPASLFDRIPFPGPALAARVLGEVTPDRVKIVRKSCLKLKFSSIWPSCMRTASRVCGMGKGISVSRSRSVAGTVSMPDLPRLRDCPMKLWRESPGRSSKGFPAWSA
jgi:GMP synthase (glutamine-hydrolysing)